MTWEEDQEIDAILGCGVSLEAAGSDNWGLTREQTLIALDALRAEQIPILGGDVWERTPQGVQSHYDGWYCEPQTGENLSDFVERSIQVSQTYVLNYPAEEKEVLFELVPLRPSRVEYVRLVHQK